MKDAREQIEIERKYIIAIPDKEDMCSMKNYTESRITQTYLESVRGETHRVRMRECNGKTEYTETRKIRIDKMSVTEQEASLDESEYLVLLRGQRRGTRPIVKERYTFVYRGQLFEIDKYPDWQSTCILETELPSRETVVEFPEFIRVVKEVTGERCYSNAAMAESFPPEIICDTSCLQEL